MKTRNIITIISIIFTVVMTSCSSEGDVLSEMEGQNKPAEIAAAISCSINKMETKASMESGDKVLAGEGEGVKSVIFFLMKGNDVLGCKENVNAQIFTKKQSGLSVIAVANASTEVAGKLRTATNRDAIMAVALGTDDLASLVKIGEAVINESDYKENNSTVTANVAVTVYQVAARIDLSKLTVNVKAADSKVVKLTKVELVNQNVNGRLDREAASFSNGSINTVSSNTINMTTGKVEENLCHFYTFANTDTKNMTAMQLTFEVDGKEVPVRTFNIKHSDNNNVVKSGYLYRLNITVNVYGENVEPEVTFTVADWKTSQVSGDMIEVKE